MCIGKLRSDADLSGYNCKLKKINVFFEKGPMRDFEIPNKVTPKAQLGFLFSLGYAESSMVASDGTMGIPPICFSSKAKTGAAKPP